MGNIISFKFFVINWLLSIITVEWALSKLEPCRIKTEKDKELAKKYPEFKRNDLHKIRRPILYLLAPFTFLRFVIGWFSVVLLCLGINIFLIGHEKDKPLPKWRFKLIKFINWLAGRVILLMMGVLYVDMPNIKADYSKYLGPDWKPTSKGAGVKISNH